MQLQHPPAEYNNLEGGEVRRCIPSSTSSTHNMYCRAALLITSFVALGLSISSLFAVTTTAVDLRLTVAQRTSSYFNNLDLRQWNLTLDFFEDTYFSDYNIEGATPMTLNRKINWLTWKCFLAGFNTTHHQLGNIVVDFAEGVTPDGSSTVIAANVTAKGTATHNFNGQLWRTAGMYNIRLRRHANGGPFRLFYIKYRQHWATGDETALSRFAKIAAWEKNSAFCKSRGFPKPTSASIYTHTTTQNGNTIHD